MRLRLRTRFVLPLLLAIYPAAGFAQTLASVRQVVSRPAPAGLKNALLDLQRHYGIELIFEDQLVLGKTTTGAAIDYSVGAEKNLTLLLKATGLRYRKLRRSTYIISEAPRSGTGRCSACRPSNYP